MKKRRNVAAALSPQVKVAGHFHNCCSTRTDRHVVGAPPAVAVAAVAALLVVCEWFSE